MKKILSSISLFALSVAIAFGSAKVGETAPAFTLKDKHGKEVSLADYAGKTVVLEWVNPGCPFVRKFYDEGHMGKFQKMAAGHGAVWLTINSTKSDHGDYLSPEQSAEWAKKHGFAASWLMDTDGTVGRAYGATRTPEMFVINPEGVVVYHGAIDSVRDAKPSSIDGAENYVMAALQSLKAGAPVATPQTIPYGCTIKY